MTREQFLEFHNGYYGEEVDNLKQIVSTTFSGEELYEYALALLKFKSKLQEVVSAVEKDKIESGKGKWEVDNVVRIIDNISCHNFEINDNVKLLRYDIEDEVWEAQGINGRWWISEKEGELV